MADVNIEPSWKAVLSDEFAKPYFGELVRVVHTEYSLGTCFAPGHLIVNAFDSTAFAQVKVVILGQDPYHGVGQTHRLCFNVNDGVDFPPSLRNIFQEIQAETGAPIPQSGNLSRWASQGVFLLNPCLTVRAHQAFSHSKHGWETFTDEVIRLLSQHREHLVFLLWGAPAGRKASFIDSTRHLVLRGPHPSPLSAYRGFFGNGHFRQCNEYLQAHGMKGIEW